MKNRKFTAWDVAVWVMLAPFIIALLPIYISVRMIQGGWYALNELLGRIFNTY